MIARRVAASAAACALAIVAACSTPSSDARLVETLPDRATFKPVAQVLERRCGSLDCHGTIYRNLRVFGGEGLRLDAKDRPRPNEMKDAEVDEDFTSVAGLEPEIMTQVVASGGANPERLTLVRKARGEEAHKGGSILRAGDDGDACVTSWLAGRADAAACARAAPPLQ